MSARRLTLIAVLLALAALVAGCGGGGGGGTTAKTTSTTPSPAVAKAQIRQNWTKFFNASTPTSERVKLLQNGQQFQPVLAAQSKGPLASQSSAKVSGVTLQGPAKATVKYTILVSNQPVLKNRTGTAVLENGTWKVADASFCQLLALQGKPPAICPKSSG